jgi:NADPH2:quinone reductase
MKALLSIRVGGPETLVVSETTEPVPGPGEVRIAVATCGINYPDVLIIEDRYQFRPARPFSPGAEVAGVIDAIGVGVTRLRLGEPVVAYTGWGGLAEKVVVAEHRCAPFPQQLPFDVAATLQITYGTALHALEDRAALKSGEALLVLGASGGVGLAAVELGKAKGARVVAATSSEEKSAWARAHGADRTIVYPRDTSDPKSLAVLFKDACGGTADVVFDPLGGGYSEPALRTMAWGGRFLVVGFAAGVPSIPMNLPLLKGCQICGVFWGAHVEHAPDRYADQLRRLFDWCIGGGIRPLISERFALRDGGQAIARLAQRGAVGKLVVNVRE